MFEGSFWSPFEPLLGSFGPFLGLQRAVLNGPGVFLLASSNFSGVNKGFSEVFRVFLGYFERFHFFGFSGP